MKPCKMKPAYERLIELLRQQNLAPLALSQVIEAQQEQIRILQGLLRESRLQQAWLLLMVKALIDEREQVA